MPIEHVHPEGAPTPTVRELYELDGDYAKATAFDKNMKPTAFRLTPRGHALLNEIQRKNAEATLARGSAKEERKLSMERAVQEKQKVAKRAPQKKSWTPS